MDTTLGSDLSPGFKLRPGWVLAAVMLAALMQVVDVTIAAVAIPEMQGNLSASPDQISWVLTSYIIATAIMTPAVGWLSARIGRRRLFFLSISGFTVAGKHLPVINKTSNEKNQVGCSRNYSGHL